MPATRDEQASYLLAFDEWRAAMDDYRASIRRVIDGGPVSVVAMHAKAIALAVLHAVWLQRSLPLVA